MKTITFIALLSVPLFAYSFWSKPKPIQLTEATVFKMETPNPKVEPIPVAKKIEAKVPEQAIVPALEISPTELSLAFENSDLCGIWKVVSQKSVINDKDAPALAKALNSGATLQRMLSSSGVFFGPITSKNPTTELEKFVLALRLSQGHYNMGFAEADFRRALALASELVETNPNNIAYWMIKLRAQKEVGAKKEQIVETLEKMESAGEFESPLSLAFLELEDSMLLSSAHYMVLRNFVPGITNWSSYSYMDIVMALDREHNKSAGRNLASILENKLRRQRSKYVLDNSDWYLYQSLPSSLVDPSANLTAPEFWPYIHFGAPEVGGGCNGDKVFEEGFQFIRTQT